MFPISCRCRANSIRYNHNLLNTLGRGLEWLSVTGGAKSYIDTIMANFPSKQVFLNQPVISVVNDPATGSVTVTTADGTTATYDHVILATPAPQALSLVSKTATPLESSILSAFETTTNTAVLHSDETLLPQNRRVWSTWNYLSNGAADQVCVTYNMNRAQGVSHAKYGSVLVTMNPLFMPDVRTIQGVFQYEHPLFTPAAVRAQTMLPRIQGTRGISYVGAWTMYGFHEDAFTSAFGVVEELGAKIPFPVADSRLRGGAVKEVRWLEYVFRLVLQGVQGLIVWLVGGGKGKQKAR